MAAVCRWFLMRAMKSSVFSCVCIHCTTFKGGYLYNNLLLCKSMLIGRTCALTRLFLRFSNLKTIRLYPNSLNLFGRLFGIMYYVSDSNFIGPLAWNFTGPRKTSQPSEDDTSWTIDILFSLVPFKNERLQKLGEPILRRTNFRWRTIFIQGTLGPTTTVLPYEGWFNISTA